MKVLNIFENNSGITGIGSFLMITLTLHFFIYAIGYFFRKEQWTKENISKKIFKLEMIYVGIMVFFLLPEILARIF